MTVVLSTKGQIVVPKEIRERAGLGAGDKLEVSLENGTVQLRKTSRPPRRRLKIKINKQTGFPCFDVPANAPPITDEWVKEQLADFP
jgi:AbrB family looped-hinge helix DNA binding protein